MFTAVPLDDYVYPLNNINSSNFFKQKFLLGRFSKNGLFFENSNRRIQFWVSNSLNINTYGEIEMLVPRQV